MYDLYEYFHRPEEDRLKEWQEEMNKYVEKYTYIEGLTLSELIDAVEEGKYFTHDNQRSWYDD
jgi:hypothetical protein